MDGPDCAIATATIGTIKVQVPSNNWAIEGKLMVTAVGAYAIILVSLRYITSFNSINEIFVPFERQSKFEPAGAS